MSESTEGKTGKRVLLPQQTLEAVAKSMYRQAEEYGFNREDYIRFVNILLDLAFEKKDGYTPQGLFHKDDSDLNISIKGARVRLRRYSPDDLPLLQNWVNDPEGRYFLTSRSAHHERTLEDLVNSLDSEFAIVLLENAPIGALAFLDINRQHRMAELRKLIGDPMARGQGYAREATQYWIEYGITNLGLRKIYLSTLETNLANIQLNEQLGFRVEGLLREECIIDGKYHDILRMGLIVHG